MNHFLILCVDENPDVLNKVVSDLDSLKMHFDIETVQSVEDAKTLLQNKPKHMLALVLSSHIMKTDLGVDFLIYLASQPSTAKCKKVLMTASAGLEDTVQAINQANLDYFITKPWEQAQLLAVVKEQLTNFIIENKKNLLPWLQVLDTDKIMQAMNKRRHEFSDN